MGTDLLNLSVGHSVVGIARSPLETKLQNQVEDEDDYEQPRNARVL